MRWFRLTGRILLWAFAAVGFFAIASLLFTYGPMVLSPPVDYEERAVSTPVVGSISTFTPTPNVAASTSEYATATTMPDQKTAIIVVEEPTVNVRGGPGTNYGIVGHASKGENFKVTGKNPGLGDWWQIDYNGQTGWMHNSIVNTSNTDFVQVALVIPAPPPSASREEQPPTVEQMNCISAYDLLAEYGDNTFESSGGNILVADEKYKGKYINVCGLVGTVDKLYGDYFAMLTFWQDYSYLGDNVQCYFPEKRASQFKNLIPGKQAILRGKVTGKPLVHVTLEDCTVVQS